MAELNENELIGSFVDFYNKKAEETKFQMGFNFNVLAEQCGNIVENSHTNMLMCLLEYKNKYGYVFLEDFISMAGFDIKIGEGDVCFKRESPTESEAGRNGRIDGFIYQKNNFAIIIENKINHAGNQKKQIERYIDDIIEKNIVPYNRIYVVFLTRDGVENPDKDSIEKMKNMGICEKDDDEQITGPRYFPCSYSQHILNWLKDNIHPMVPQKDVVLNAGIIQYIDYLESLLGCSPNLLRFNNEFKKWFEREVTLSGNTKAKNDSLYKLYNSLLKKKNTADIKKSEAINVMKNIIEAKNDELMDTLLTVTKNYFTSGLKPLIEEYHINHHFTYYYITIRDKKWPRGIDFGWYPLGLKKLSKSNEMTFNFKAYGKKLSDSVEQELIKKGFVYSTKSKSYRKTIDIGNGTFFDMNEEQQKAFLEEAYRTSAVPIIKDIIPKI